MYPDNSNRRRIAMYSAMQKGIANAIRAAHTTRGAQSWRTRDVVVGKNEPCASLEMIIDEKLAQGASDKAVMLIAYEVVRQTRAKIIASRAEQMNLARAYEHEEQRQGMASVAQMRALASKCGSSLRAACAELFAHRDAIDDAIEATEAELLKQQEEEVAQGRARAVARYRLGAEQ